jgi:hypothetical protein
MGYRQSLGGSGSLPEWSCSYWAVWWRQAERQTNTLELASCLSQPARSFSVLDWFSEPEDLFSGRKIIGTNVASGVRRTQVTYMAHLYWPPTQHSALHFRPSITALVTWISVAPGLFLSAHPMRFRTWSPPCDTGRTRHADGQSRRSTEPGPASRPKHGPRARSGFRSETRRRAERQSPVSYQQ